jgi:hypothetical protein
MCPCSLRYFTSKLLDGGVSHSGAQVLVRNMLVRACVHDRVAAAEVMRSVMEILSSQGVPQPIVEQCLQLASSVFNSLSLSSPMSSSIWDDRKAAGPLRSVSQMLRCVALLFGMSLSPSVYDGDLLAAFDLPHHLLVQVFELLLAEGTGQSTLAPCLQLLTTVVDVFHSHADVAPAKVSLSQVWLLFAFKIVFSSIC